MSDPQTWLEAANLVGPGREAMERHINWFAPEQTRELEQLERQTLSEIARPGCAA
jgi:hypothetical protein